MTCVNGSRGRGVEEAEEEVEDDNNRFDGVESDMMVVRARILSVDGDDDDDVFDVSSVCR
tara:strand:- start:747 stop:926 length:180 start_codon:yes stop_codon:yes gene_type:complete